LWYLLDGSLEVLLASVGLATNIMQDFLPLSYFFLLLHWGQLIFQSAEDVSAKVVKMTDSGLYF
ncbi:hypothetical protein, partial [Cloacibacillus evryensis]